MNSILKELDTITREFNNHHIDYFLTGGLVVPISTNTPLYRKHNDIDIMINIKNFKLAKWLIWKHYFTYQEQDLDTFEATKKGISDYRFGHNYSLIPRKSNCFNIGIYLFNRELNDIYQYKYYKDENKIGYFQTRYSESLSKLIFEETPKTYNNINARTVTLEQLYYIKKMLDTSYSKDIQDLEIMESHINQEKLDEISYLSDSITYYDTNIKLLKKEKIRLTI